jgi:hypothetical protein
MSYALLADSTVRAWGGGANGELGNGTRPTTSQTTPVRVSGLTNVVALAAGRSHGLVTVSVWSRPHPIQTTTTRLAPLLIDGIDDAVEAHGGRGYTVVRRNTA